MKFNSFKKQMTPMEIGALVIFIIYLIIPFKTPRTVSHWVNSSAGILGILVVTTYLFMYAHPALGILYLFVAYELLRRSGNDFVQNAEPLGTSYNKMPMNPYAGKKNTQYQNNDLAVIENDDNIYSNKVRELSAVDSSYAPIGVNSKSVDENNNTVDPNHNETVNENNVKNMSLTSGHLEEEITNNRNPYAVLGEMGTPSYQSNNFTTSYDSSSLSLSPI